jgi:SET domain-containing protein
LDVRNSDIHGLGVFAKRRFSAGALIGTFEGSRHPPGVDVASDNSLMYLFQMQDGSTVDGSKGGNATRHVNHSCHPNCTAGEEPGSDGTIDIVYRTVRPIRPGQELSIDYRLILEDPDLPSNYVCHCGAKSCRGTMADVTA